MNHLTLSFLGAFQATLGDKPLTKFRWTKAQGLLIYLALTKQKAHGRDVLAALFWPEESEKIAKQNLRQSLYLLRKLLRDDDGNKQDREPFLLITRATVQFNPASDHRLDAADFLSALKGGKLETAVSLYQGDLLPDFYCDSLPFDDWLRQEREQYHRQALDALNKLATYSLTRADFQTAERSARQQLRLEPWREEAHRQLMQALALQGERSAALAQFETCRTVLAEELGLEPTIETVTLAQRIREIPIKQPAQREAGGDLGRRFSIPFVGRKPEFEALVNAYRRSANDGVQIVTLSGKAGIGKTRLIQHFLAWAATQGADVLVGRSFETSAGLSYQPLTHLLRQRLERENAPEDLLSDLWLSQLTRLLPELRGRYPDLPPPTQEEATAKQHLFEAITRLGQALAARQPLILFVDDWHWADAASLDVLHYAAVRWAEEKTPITLLLTLRQEAINESPDLQSWLTRFHHDAPTIPIQLSEITQSETEQLIRRLLEPETDNEASKITQFSDWLFTETDGQPLFLTETLKSLVAEGLVRSDLETARSASSTSLSNTGQAVWHIDWARFDQQMEQASGRVLPEVQQIIRGWLDRITAPAAKLLTGAAILANEISFDHLCQVAELDQFEALAALDELLGKQLLVEVVASSSTATAEPTYSFSHQKVSALVYAEAGAARRRILHRRAFEVYQMAAAAAADCAHHAINAGLLSETIHYSLVAGNEAMDIFAFPVAITHFETAFQVSEQKGWPDAISGADRQALYTGLGRAYELIEAWPKAQKTYETMIAYAQTIGAPTMECLGLNHLATIYWTTKDLHQALTLLEQARTLAEQHGDRRGLAETEWGLSVVAHMGGDAYSALQHGEQALAIARELEHRQLMARCLNMLGYVYFRRCQWEQAEAYGGEARGLFAAAGNQILAADSQRMVGTSQMLAGRPQESLITLQETFAFSRQIENLWGETEAARMLADTLLELGHYGQAITLGRQASQQARIVVVPGIKQFAILTWGTVQRTVMALESAQKTLLEEAGIGVTQGFIGWTDWAQAELCVVHSLAGEWEQAHNHALQTLKACEDQSLLPRGLSYWYVIEALVRGGDEDLARAEVKRLSKIVGTNKRYHLILHRSQAVLAQWDGDLDQAIAHLQAALALAQEIGLPGEAWPIWGELGRLYGEQGEKEKAREVYEEAAVIIHRLADTIDEDELREGYLTAVSVQSILEKLV